MDKSHKPPLDSPMHHRLIAFLALCLGTPALTAQVPVFDSLDTPLVPAGIAPFSYLGHQISVAGDALVASSPGLDVGQAGSAWAFWKVSGAWQAGQEITHSNAEVGDGFGKSLASTNDTLVISASGHSLGARLYIYDRVGNDWIESQVLGLAGSTSFFGGTVALDDQRLVSADVGVPGQATHVFVRTPTGWTLEQTLPGHAGHVTIDGDTLTTVTNGNAVTVFERVAGTWTQVASFPFGGVIGRPDLQGDLLVVPALNELRLHERINGVWDSAQRLRASIRYSGTGAFASIDGDRIVAISGPFQAGQNAWVSLWVRESAAAGMGAEWSERQVLNVYGSVAEVRLTADFDGETLAVGDWTFDASLVGSPRTGAVYTAELAEASEFFGDSYCHGDTTECPCGFSTTFPRSLGCQGSTLGALLVGSGSQSFGANATKMDAFGMPAQVSALLFFGTQNAAGSTPFGNGLLCVSGPFRRAGIRQTNASGRATWGQGPAAFGPAGSIAPGDEIAFQVWYRDPGAACAQGFNLTNGFRMTFTP